MFGRDKRQPNREKGRQRCNKNIGRERREERERERERERRGEWRERERRGERRERDAIKWRKSITTAKHKGKTQNKTEIEIKKEKRPMDAAKIS